MKNNDDWIDEFERDWDDKEFHEKDNGPLRMVALIVLVIIGASALAISLMLAFL